MAREDPQMKLRVSAEMLRQLQEAAARANRSVNAEVVHRLEASFSTVSDRIAELEVYVFSDTDGNRSLSMRLALIEQHLGLFENSDTEANLLAKQVSPSR